MVLSARRQAELREDARDVLFHGTWGDHELVRDRLVRATFVTAVPTWREGDKVLIRPGFEFEIVAIDESAGDANGTWIIRRCRRDWQNDVERRGLPVGRAGARVSQCVW